MSAETETGEAPGFENLPPRLDLIAPADLDDAQRAVYAAITGGPRASQAGTVPIVDESGRLAGPFAVMLLTPEVGNAMQQVGAKIRFSARLTPRERELGILSVAGRLRSDFERLAHEPAAIKAGLTRAQVNAVLTGRVPGGLTEDEALIARLAQVMTVDRTLPDQEYATGVAALGKERLAELTWLVGYYSALALALSVFRPAIPESFTAARKTGELAKSRPHGLDVCDRLAWNLSYRPLQPSRPAQPRDVAPTWLPDNHFTAKRAGDASRHGG